MSDAEARARAAEGVAREELARVPDWLWDGGALPVPLEAIVDSHYGLLVEEVSGLATRPGSADAVHVSGILYPSDRVIAIDAEEAARAPGRRRFSIAHELGHWIMHCGGRPAEAVCGERSSSDLVSAIDRALAARLREVEANAFAAAVLMPRELLLAHDRPRGEDEEYLLAGRLGVSRDALIRRYQTLERSRSR